MKDQALEPEPHRLVPHPARRKRADRFPLQKQSGLHSHLALIARKVGGNMLEVDRAQDKAKQQDHRESE
jgi:hypothetical protein